MGEWKQTESYPKRMLKSIQETKARIRKEQLLTIQKEKPVEPCASCGSTLHSTERHAVRASRGLTKPSISRVASIPIPTPILSPQFPYTRTKRARRYLKKHPGFPVNQYPTKKEVTA